MTQEIIFGDSDDKGWTQALYEYIHDCGLTNTWGHCLPRALPPRHLVLGRHRPYCKKKVRRPRSFECDAGDVTAPCLTEWFMSWWHLGMSPMLRLAENSWKQKFSNSAPSLESSLKTSFGDVFKRWKMKIITITKLYKSSSRPGPTPDLLNPNSSG